MAPTLETQTRLVQHCIKHLQAGYHYLFGNQASEYEQLTTQIASRTLETIARSDAPYHNLEHTIIVTLVGKEMLCGKYLCQEPFSESDWLHFIVSLLCHDIGYLKGICAQDDRSQRCYTTGMNDGKTTLSPMATDASLAPYHVDRGKQFVAEALGAYALIDVERIQLNIELTRFPVPKDDLHRDTLQYPGLVRAADLIGQLSDPAYLAKLPLLFREFEEIGSHKAMGYHEPKDLRTAYPRFYWHGVYPYLRHGIRYLEMSEQGRAILANLSDNLVAVENELMLALDESH